MAVVPVDVVAMADAEVVLVDAAATADVEACGNSDVAHNDTRDDNKYGNACNGAHDNTHDNDREPADDAWAVLEVTVVARVG